MVDNRLKMWHDENTGPYNQSWLTAGMAFSHKILPDFYLSAQLTN